MSIAKGQHDATGVAALTDLLRTTLAEELAVLPSSVTDGLTFHDLGLRSVQALSLVTRLGRALDRTIPVYALWQHPTVPAFARYLAGESAAVAPAAPPAAASAGEPVAIVGLGCRLPGGVEDAGGLWQALLDGLDAVREVPADRWDAQAWLDADPATPGTMTTRWGGFLDDAHGFDADLFRISPAEAAHLDPQQRLALEVAWSALEDARIVPGALAGTRTGVFLGTMAQEYHLATGADADTITAHSATGWDSSVTAARIAYALGLQGPAMAVATACSSSLTATHLAVQSLRSGESDLALAGGVNVMLHPHTTVAMTKLGAMSPDGHCRAFSADANGYVRGEGCGVVVLRRLSDALRDGDRVYAVIRGTALNNDGASNGLTAPNPQAQVDVVREAWHNAGVRTADVDYIEAHGTGTPLGDPIEAESLGTVFAEGRTEALRIGSAKTNFGHLEPAAGVLGLLKAALALHHGEIPGNLHYGAPNPHIDFDRNRLSVVTARSPWPAASSSRRRHAGVSAFGFGGTNAHVALEEAPGARGRYAVALAAESETELAEAAGALATRPAGAGTAPLLVEGTGPYRLFVAAEHQTELVAALHEAATATPSSPTSRPRIVFAFSGHGAQWLGMGRDLLGEPEFRAGLEAADRALRPVTGWSLLDELTADPSAGPSAARLGRTDVLQPVLFGLQTALVRLLRSRGVRPDAVFGQSIGEVAAAVTAGVLSLEDGARVIGTWSALVAEQASGRGAMVVCELERADAERLLAAREGLSLAGHLAPGQVSVSGRTEDVAALERELSEAGVRVHRVAIDYAAHSTELSSLAPELLRRLDGLRGRAGQLPLWSTVTAGLLDGTELDAAYWARNMCEPMRLAETVAALAADGEPLCVVEVGPHPVVEHSLRRSLPDGAVVAPTCRRDRPAPDTLTDLTGLLWTAGCSLDRPDAVRPVPVALPVSGRTEAALAGNAARLADHLEARPATLAGAALTAARYRTRFEHRAVVVARTAAEAVDGLRAVAEGRPGAGVVSGRPVEGGLAVLFTGQGSQRLGMGRGLYESNAAFRVAFDEVLSALDGYVARPLKEVVFGEDAGLLNRTEFTQPALFALEVALFRLWESWGVTPAAVAGHSVGELAAAHVAGVLSLDDAARLVVARGRLMQACESGGAMASIEAGEEEVLAVLEGRVSVAGVNSPTQTVVSGDPEAVERLIASMPGRRTRRLEVSHAFHSAHMDAMLEEFTALVATCDLRAPRIPLVSTLDGSRMTADLAEGEGVRDPQYWARQAREAVRFLDAVKELGNFGIHRFLECGPSGVLSAMGAACAEDATFVPTLRATEDELTALLTAAATLHTTGQHLDWTPTLPANITPTPLPPYAFQREPHRLTAAPAAARPKAAQGVGEQRLWQAVERGEADQVAELIGVSEQLRPTVAPLLPYLKTWRARSEESAEVADWLYQEDWQALDTPKAGHEPAKGHWLLVGDPAAGGLAAALEAAGGTVHLIASDAEPAAAVTEFATRTADGTVRGVLALTAEDVTPDPAHPAVTRGAVRTLALVQALVAAYGEGTLRAPLWVVTSGAVRADARDAAPEPRKAAAWGLGRVVALEHPLLWGGLIDLPTDGQESVAAQLIATLTATDGEQEVALRPSGRRARRLVRHTPEPGRAAWRARGTALVTGGSGALAAHVARRLAERGVEHLVLASRRGAGAEGAAQLRAELEALGVRVDQPACDVTDRAELARLVEEFGADLRLVVHTAGVLDDRLVDHLDPAALAAVAAPKAEAAFHLDELTRESDLDAFVLFSSVVGTLGNVGQANYAMANAALDALAEARRAAGLPATAVAWGPWATAGMADGRIGAHLDALGLVPMPAERALACLDTALAGGRSLVAARIDWERAAVAYDGPALRGVPEAERPAAPVASHGSYELPAQDPLGHLRDLLAEEAAAVLGVKNPRFLDADRGFKDLGFDSMMAIDLSRRIERRTGVATPKTLVYDQPNLHAAAAWLLGRLGQPVPAQAPTGTAPAARSEEPIAIVGVGLRMPGDAHDLDSLWTVLAEGRDTLRPIPADRFDIDAAYDPDPEAEGRTYVREAALLGDVASFDAAFFGISPREAEPMDPQHRLLLETAWNALEHAGIRPRDLRDSATGVFIGAGAGEYGDHRLGADRDTYTLTGRLQSFHAGRIAYHLGLQGPALAVDTACSSSLVALHLACEALRAGTCELALAGGVQVLADPGAFVALSRSRALAPDGRSKTFSADADGYGRGEGAGVVAVMRLSDALAQGREVLGVVRATAVNHDGASSGITAPNGSSQQKVLRAALTAAGLAPGEVDYVECHGTGTSLGDPIEVQALAAVYGEGREAGRPLGLGSAKAVIGHLESAAGIAGVCKVLASLRHGMLPAAVHSSPRNPNIAWDELPVRVVDEATPWERGGERVRRAGVSAFGLSGTNAHVILEEAPAASVVPETVQPVAVPVLVSGRDEAVVREQAARWASWLDAHSAVPLADVAVTAARYRTQFEHRAVVVAGSVVEAAARLRALADGEPVGVAGTPGEVVFVYPGQGSQWLGMGAALLEQSPVFRAAVEACDEALRPLTGWSVREVLAGGGGDHPPVDRVDVVQPALFAMGVALSALWRSWGVEPTAVVGHSQGEVVAAVVSGALSLEQGARVVALRSAAVRAVTGFGGMALVERPVADVEELIASYDGKLSIAAVNTPGSTVVSGESAAIDALVSDFQQQDVFCRRVNVDYASHSAQMDQLLPELSSAFADLKPSKTVVPFYSTVLGRVLDGPELDGAYWCRNLREPVRFDRALEQLLADGRNVFVEVSAHPVLSMPLTDGSAEHNGVVVGSLARGEGGIDQLLRSLGQLHVQGVPVDWSTLLDGRFVPDLPTYAFQREHYWAEVATVTTDPGAMGLETPAHPWLGAATALAEGEGHLFTGRLTPDAQPWLRDHAAFGTVLVPGTGLLELAWAAADSVGAARVAELTLSEPLVLEGPVRLQVTVGAPDAEGRRTIAIHGRPEDGTEAWTLHASGQLADGQGESESFAWLSPASEPVDLDGFYDRFAARGLAYGPAFRGLTELWRDGDTAYGTVRLPEGLAAGEYGVHPALLDTALHVLQAVVADRTPDGTALLPFEWSDADLHLAGCTELRVRIDAVEVTGGHQIEFRAADPTGRPVARIGGLNLREAKAEQLARATWDLYRVEYQPVALPAAAPTPAPGTVVVLGGDGALAARLGAAHLADVTASAGAKPAPTTVVVDATAPADPDRTEQLTAAALRTLQRLLAEPGLAGAELVWATSGSTAAVDGDTLPGLAHAPLQGLLRTARTEHPERTIRLLDLDLDDPGQAAAALALTDEPELALRGGRALAPRLVRVQDRAAATPAIRPDGTVLITGGTGELGRQVAAELVRRHGVRRLVLTSRQGADAPGATETAQALLAAGAESVQVVACDVARRDDVEKVLALAGPDAPWTAVLHLAGVLDDGLLAGQDEERLARVLAPKVTGALHLDELTRELALDAFVLFSSAAGVLGTAGQGVYAAANSFLDALAARRRAGGRTGSSLAWGLWEQAGVGMTSHLGGAELARMRRQGIAPLPVDQGLRLLGAALARPAENLVPVRLDLASARRAADGGGRLAAVLRALAPAAPRRRAAATARTAAEPAGLRERLAALPVAERREALLGTVLREIAAVLGGKGGATLSPRQVLKQLGLDSLMAVELRRRLAAETGLTLPATLAFDHPTPDAIATLLLDRLGLTGPPAPASASEQDPSEALGWALARLSAEQIQRAGLLDRLVELVRQEEAAPTAVPSMPSAPSASPERSVDDLNAELDALLGVGLDLL
ncbi:SDR family NAD(P)-dependent oxidoreductase [Kitasatospora sp. NPDC101183]|uniref:SDR family NAD(P)-dependent oxidoreductase n=1 Tax=Kitasatospora sp. NPDC101183 TaxID=3364100 RepID=UPI003813AA31